MSEAFPNLALAPDIDGSEIHLSNMRPSMVSRDYVDWMNDPEVTKFTESRFVQHTRESLENYVGSVELDARSLMWAIMVAGVHIGNIKIGPVDWPHALADIGLIIGAKSHWGMGYGAAAISLVAEWAFGNLNLHKITAGICDGNTGSVRAFEKAGFHIEARQSCHYFLAGEYRDRLIMARFNARPVNPVQQS